MDTQKAAALVPRPPTQPPAGSLRGNRLRQARRRAPKPAAQTHQPAAADHQKPPDRNPLRRRAYVQPSHPFQPPPATTSPTKNHPVHVLEGIKGNVEREEFSIEEIRSTEEEKDDMVGLYVLIGLGLVIFFVWRFQMRQLVDNMNRKNV
ncbi:unnamed protein product [Rhodiola kirilowii]